MSPCAWFLGTLRLRKCPEVCKEKNIFRQTKSARKYCGAEILLQREIILKKTRTTEKHWHSSVNGAASMCQVLKRFSLSLARNS